MVIHEWIIKYLNSDEKAAEKQGKDRNKTVERQWKVAESKFE